jgi:hypothetical protein
MNLKPRVSMSVPLSQAEDTITSASRLDTGSTMTKTTHILYGSVYKTSSDDYGSDVYPTIRGVPALLGAFVAVSSMGEF